MAKTIRTLHIILATGLALLAVTVQGDRRPAANLARRFRRESSWFRRRAGLGPSKRRLGSARRRLRRRQPA